MSPKIFQKGGGFRGPICIWKSDGIVHILASVIRFYSQKNNNEHKHCWPAYREGAVMTYFVRALHHDTRAILLCLTAMFFAYLHANPSLPRTSQHTNGEYMVSKG